MREYYDDGDDYSGIVGVVDERGEAVAVADGDVVAADWRCERRIAGVGGEARQ